MSSIIPFFRDSGFDTEAIQNLGKAYDIACRSLHPKGQPPVVQESLATKIIEAAQRGERDPDRLAAIALGMLGAFHSDVTRRFGLIPNFFMSAPDAPEIVEKLWDFAKSAYLDNPIPSLFKERLFVFLSRFCPVRYCIVRHCGFLVGYGQSSGDARPRRKPSSRCSSYSRHPRHGGGRSNRFIKVCRRSSADRLARRRQRTRRVDVRGVRRALCRTGEGGARQTHCDKHWAASVSSISSRCSHSSELRTIGPSCTPASKSKTTCVS